MTANNSIYATLHLSLQYGHYFPMLFISLLEVNIALLAQVFERLQKKRETCVRVELFIFEFITVMRTKYKILNPDNPCFITFSTVYWIDVFSRKEYKDIVLESMQFCKEKKGLQLFAYPVKAGIVLSSEEYLYSSAKNYAGLKEYLIDVDFLD
jgi:hypothetical protein